MSGHSRVFGNKIKILVNQIPTLSGALVLDSKQFYAKRKQALQQNIKVKLRPVATFP